MVLKGEEFRGMNSDSVEVEWESKTASNLVVCYCHGQRMKEKANVKTHKTIVSPSAYLVQFCLF